MSHDDSPSRSPLSAAPPQDLVERLPVPVAVTNTRGEILYANSSFRHHFGAGSAQLPPLFAVTSREAVEGLLSGDQLSATLQRVDGERFSVTVRPRPSADETTFVLHPMPSPTDQNEQHSRRLEAIVQLAAGVAHEVNNPLAVIQGRLELIDLLEIEVPPALDPHLKIIDQHSKRISRIVRSLQGIARPPLQKRSRASVSELLEGVRAMGGAALTELEIEIDVEPIDLAVDVDARQLQRALLNLLDNSADAMPQGGRVSLIARRDEDAVRIDVCDEGPGIPQELLPHLFAPFVSGRPRAERSGLGLAVTRGIVQEHGGSLLASNRANGGACFSLTLPISEDAETAAPHAVQEETRRLRILCVEDETALLQMVQGMARTAGHEVVTAQNAEEALELARHHHFDVVLTDVHLPGRSGLELRRDLFQVSPDLARHTLLMSGYYQDLPPDIPYLQKPFRMKHLLDAIAEVSRR